ncbi:MAG TPA: aminopeptidase P N-terminal domain-containing protein [Flavobacteriales bacterium]|nr:aminopeptidase P N-terminal domain-containing protein [Flavobacteriales bacterium]HRJ38853.1 aminopeptidase P N-terminal domain-containing protein [Flavobacteriales bacterium]
MKYILILFLVLAMNPILHAQEHKHLTIKGDSSLYDQDMLPASFHKQRREEVRKLMPDSSIAVFFAAPIRNRSNDVDYEYHQDPNFYYLSGFNESNAVLVITKTPVRFGSVITNEIIFVQDKDPGSEVWTGRRLGADQAKNVLEIDVAFQSSAFGEYPFNFGRFSKVLIVPQHGDVRDDKNDRGDLFSMIKMFNDQVDPLKGKVNRYKLPEIMATLRQIKTAEEIILLRKAIDITCQAQMELMKTLRPGMKEYQTEAIVEFVFATSGAESEGFPSIQGGGSNGCILHYNTNRKTLTSKDLLVSDIGAEYHGYTADVTRTLPVNGRFNKEQAIIYDIVLRAQDAGIAKCKIGNKFWDPHEAATEVITKGLLELGIIKKAGEVKKYFLHGTSHYLGLDVHDPGLYGTLQANMVITVEPGIYIPEGSDCDPKWWNIGIRIEDDILITSKGPENLSACVPRTMAEIERIMAQSSLFEQFIPGK